MNAAYRQLRELEASVIRQMPVNLPDWWVQRLIEHPAELGVLLQNALKPQKRSSEEIFRDLIRDWETFYAKVFKIKVDISKIPLPPEQVGFEQLVFLVPGLTLEKVCTAIEKRHGVVRAWVSNGSQPPQTYDERTLGNAPYAIRMRGDANPDEKLRRVSGEQIKNDSIRTVTLLEYLLFGLKVRKYHELDSVGGTLCSGSRFQDGTIPVVNFEGNGVGIDFMHAGNPQNSVRAREVLVL
ncbi:MAG: hypothetical protein KBD21_04015 [Candidatus Pacebacteria bacterium]|nr:hypothetical protein [Candidatus Paceibacterota bacterium]